MPKSVLITGCSAGGIGHALALSFQNRGLTVIATARNLSSMSLLKELPNIHLLSLDVTSPPSIAAAVQQVKAITGGTLDILINNAGRSYAMPALDSDIDEGKKVFETNFWGPLRMVQGFSGMLVDAKGVVVNVGSIVAYLHAPYTSIYNASKSALHMFSETLRIELAPLNVKLLTVVTGSISTKIMSNTPEPSLPADSYYRSLADTLKARAKGDDGIVRSTPEDFAEKVANDVLAGMTGETFRGKNATLTRYGSVVFPMALLDHILLDGTGLDKMQKR